MKSKPKIIVICGPTATGKSDLAVEVAKKIGGEIISADSRQVYKGLDIGSGKITKREMRGVPHHLLDVASPNKVFTVTDFQKLGTEAINVILNKGKVPIICGGTGFYIDALVNNLIFPDVKPDRDFRLKIMNYRIERLQKMLLKIDPERYKTVDLNNKVRLIRAIEIAKALGKVPLPKHTTIYRSIWIGLTLPQDKLKEKINLRLKKRLKVGMVAEVKNLHKNGLSWKRLESLGLEYRYVAQFLQEKIDKEEMISKLQTEIWHYAKRQMTWFKRNKDIEWFLPGYRRILNRVKNYLS